MMMDMVEIYQSDQYALEIGVMTESGEKITPDNVDELHIGLGRMVKSFPGELTYEEGKWLFPLTKTETDSMRGRVVMQAEVVRGQEITHGEPKSITVKETMVPLRRRAGVNG